jgi:hypothetical protein
MTAGRLPISVFCAPSFEGSGLWRTGLYLFMPLGAFDQGAMKTCRSGLVSLPFAGGCVGTSRAVHKIQMEKLVTLLVSISIV